MKLSFSLLVLLMFVGCTPTHTVKFPKMQKIEPKNLSWEDITHKGINGHFFLPKEWQEIQEALIIRRNTANSCIDIGNQLNKGNR